MSDLLVGSSDRRGTKEEDSDPYIASLEGALLRAWTLVESAVSVHRRQAGRLEPAVRGDLTEIDDALKGLLGQAQHTACVALAGNKDFTGAVFRVLPGLPLRVGVRTLCTATANDTALAPVRELTDGRWGARISDGELREMLVVDSAHALVLDSDGTTGRMAVINDAASVRALELLFTGAWSRGRKLADHLRLSSRLRSDLTRRILEQLRVGATDEIAACELRISLRTYRRRVAEIMRELSANSRFQAGVRAVELGLISE